MIEFLESLGEEARTRCIAKLTLLAIFGHELRRPAVDNLGNGIWELRAKHNTVQYRMLFFFHGQGVVVVSHGITKEAKIPPAEIGRAIVRKKAFDADPDGHTFQWS